MPAPPDAPPAPSTPDDLPDVLPAGTKLGRYVIVRRLGKGGYGVVYEARQVELNRRVALKTLHPEAARDPTVRARFQQEGQAAAQIGHDHIVSVLDVGEHQGLPYLVMEFLAGEDLATHLARRGRLGVTEALATLLPVLAALDAAHQRGIVHRDLKPANLFLARTSTGRTTPKVLDFGVSKVANDSKAPSLTSSAAMLGTPRYMAPEQVRASKEADHRADQYALGVILYECVTGRRPFEGSNVFVMLDAIQAGRFARPRECVPELPEGLEAAILRAMRVDPEDRYESVRAMGRALLPFAAEDVRKQWEGIFTRDEGSRDSLNAVGEEPALAETQPAPVGSLQAKLAPNQEPSRPRSLRSALPVIVGVLLFVLGVALVWRLGHPLPTRGMNAPTPSNGATSSLHCPAGMASIPAGEFMMGTAPESEGDADERPLHRVRLSAYCMDLTEVTVAQYAPCVRAGRCRPDTTQMSTVEVQAMAIINQYCHWAKPDHENYPINCVDWSQADVFCRWAGKRLPTEAEWEYSARGSDGRIYPWGNTPPNEHLLNSYGLEARQYWAARGRDFTRSGVMYERDDGWVVIAPVGRFPSGRSPFGLDDMAGNVWEWTADAYGLYDVSWSNSVLQDPIRQRGTLRVVRGGSAGEHEPRIVRSTQRIPYEVGNRFVNVGFRCAWSVAPLREVDLGPDIGANPGAAQGTLR
jgi:serine/threonine-protein kinase